MQKYWILNSKFLFTGTSKIKKKNLALLSVNYKLFKIILSSLQKLLSTPSEILLKYPQNK